MPVGLRGVTVRAFQAAYSPIAMVYFVGPANASHFAAGIGNLQQRGEAFPSACGAADRRLRLFDGFANRRAERSRALAVRRRKIGESSFFVVARSIIPDFGPRAPFEWIDTSSEDECRTTPTPIRSWAMADAIDPGASLHIGRIELDSCVSTYS